MTESPSVHTIFNLAGGSVKHLSGILHMATWSMRCIFGSRPEVGFAAAVNGEITADTGVAVKA